MFQPHFRRYTGLLVVLIAAAGCEKRGTVPLHGTVTLDGRPLGRATVYFIAQNPGGRDALGSTDADGVFHLSTFQPGDGALPGSYKVVVRPAQPDTGIVSKTPIEAMDATTHQKPVHPLVIIPPRYSQPGQTILVQDVPASGDVIFELQSK